MSTFSHVLGEQGHRFSQPISQYFAASLSIWNGCSPGVACIRLFPAGSDVLDSAGHVLVTAMRSGGLIASGLDGCQQGTGKFHCVRLVFAMLPESRYCVHRPVDRITFGSEQYSGWRRRTAVSANPMALRRDRTLR